MADISKIQVPIDGVMTEFDIKGSGGSANYYGTCTGQASNQVKTVTISSDQGFELKTGVLIFVKFDANNLYDATASNPIKLNVNNTGEKQIYAGSSSAPTGTNTTYFGRTNYINQYIYNGTYWVWNGSSADNNTTYTPQKLGFGYATCSTSESTAAKEATLTDYVLVKNGIVSVKFTYAVPANATLNINSKGAKNIWYHGTNITNNIIKAGDLATFIYDGTRYQLIGIDRETGGGSGSGGHTIIDESGISLAQEPNLQFKGADVSDDSTNNRTVVDMSYTEINYEDWLELTEQEKETGRWDVVGVPGVDGTVSFDLMTKLWENPDPTVAFAAQTINIDLTEYDLLYITAIVSVDSNSWDEAILMDLSSAKPYYIGGATGNLNIYYSRGIIKNNNGLEFYEGRTNNGYDNKYMVPRIIYGIKLHKTVEIKAIAPEVSTSASKCMMSDGETSVESKVNDVESAAITLTGFAGSIVLDRVGRICFATYLGNINSLPAGSLSFSQTLPEKFRPNHTVGFHSSATNSVKIQLFFNSNGSITGYNYGSKISSTTTCTFEALSYVARNV